MACDEIECEKMVEGRGALSEQTQARASQQGMTKRSFLGFRNGSIELRWTQVPKTRGQTGLVEVRQIYSILLDSAEKKGYDLARKAHRIGGDDGFGSGGLITTTNEDEEYNQGRDSGNTSELKRSPLWSHGAKAMEEVRATTSLQKKVMRNESPAKICDENGFRQEAPNSP